MNEFDIIKLVEATIIKANSHFKLSLDIPKVTFFEKGLHAGVAWYAEHKVEYNITFAKEYPEEFKNTVIHEISHLVTAAIYGSNVRGHGCEFKFVDMALGGTGETCHNYDLEKSKPKRTITRYICKCLCGTNKYTKKVTTGRFSCNKCKNQLVFTGEIIKIKP